jgi:hypothetical protein
MKRFILLTLVLILAACSAGGSDRSPERQQWEDAGISHYRFQLHLSCFCVFVDQMPLTVEVQDGEVVSITDVNGAAVSPGDVNHELFVQYGTIDRIFDKIEAAQADPEAGEVTVTYDPTLGIPADAAIDYVELAADDEMYVSVSGFEALP